MEVFVLFALVAVAAAWPSFDLETLEGYIQGDSSVPTAKKQQHVNRLLWKVYDHLHDGELKSIAGSFNPEGDKSIYSDGGEAVHHLVQELNDHRLLEQHHWFSLFNSRQREEALMLFDVLMHCKNWNCFVNNAAYWREKMNEGEFVYGLYVAVIHSDVAEGVVLPPLYEVTPHLFTNSEIIQQAYTAKMTNTPGKFHMEFTGTKRNKEQRVAYFGEDIGMNTHHVTWHMDYPFWWKDSYGYHLDRKGELFFWAHHQLTVRFDAERLSNYLDPVDELHWEKPIEEGFAPHTIYKYGGEFPARPDNIRFEDVDGVARVRDMIITESRIRDAIAHGYIEADDGSHINIVNERGIDKLGDIIESSLYSPNIQYYGPLHNLAHIMLGRQGDPHGKYNLPPGVMEHFETATRDPSFFRLHKYMDNIFKEHKDSLPPYTREDLDFPGVDVESIGVQGELKTYFEDYEFDLRNAVDSADGIADVDLKAYISRLNHQDFSFVADISNNNGGPVLATLRIYLCPRRDNNGQIFTFDQGHWNCIEMDKFWKKLSPGKNHIVRKSSESSVTVPDVPHFQTLIDAADSGNFNMGEFESACGIPNRMLLPKGKEDGMEFALVLAVTDGSKDAANSNAADNEHGGSHAHCGQRGEVYPDKQPMGYPIDRRIPDRRVYDETTNIQFNIVKVYHDDTHH
uniref:Hemocyanin alpha subunit 1 n=1 Tax=Atyopsis moluccensis TaxID=395616 RepID=I4EC45_9EUCA|nr:hemocyanin alpha subunit 1 [Atyopsis moluccensis]